MKSDKSHLIYKLNEVIDGLSISCEIAIRWISLDLTDGKSAFVQVMAWCYQTTSHHLSQSWPSSLLPYGTTRGQRVNSRACKFQCITNNHTMTAIMQSSNPLLFWKPHQYEKHLQVTTALHPIKCAQCFVPFCCGSICFWWFLSI